MASPAFVQAKGATSAFVTTLSTGAFSSSTIAGNAILAMVVTSEPAADVNTVTDTQGNTYERKIVASNTSSLVSIELWVARNIVGGALNVTATDTPSSITSINAVEVFGIPTTGVYLDTWTSATGNTGTVPVTMASPTVNANDLIVQMAALSGGGTWTVGSGYSNLTQTTTTQAAAMQFKQVSSTGAQSGTITNATTNQEWVTVILGLSDTSLGVDPTTTSNTYPGSVTDDATVGSLTWANPSAAASPNDVYATVTASGVTSTHYLKANTFGFSIPSGATINGITVGIEKKRTGGSTGNVRDAEVKLVKGGTVQTTNKGLLSTNIGTTDAVSVYGGPSDLWGTTWADTDINGSTFGVVYAGKGAAAGANRVINVDSIYVAVTYTPSSIPPGGAPLTGLIIGSGLIPF